MKRFVWFACVCSAMTLLPSGGVAWAQGVTSAAVAGRLTDDAGAAVASASVTLINGSTGQRYSRRSADDIAAPQLDQRPISSRAGQLESRAFNLFQSDVYFKQKTTITRRNGRMPNCLSTRG